MTKSKAYEALLKRFPDQGEWLSEDCLDYWAYPQVFGSTAGPFGGVGGQMMTTFTIEAWVCYNYAVLFCGERLIKVTDKWEGPQTVRI